MARKVAVVLSGCGFKDGAEITESVSTLIALGQFGASYQCFAPKMEIVATDHATGKPTGEKRNVLSEAARICRGEIQNIAELREQDFDAVIFPGGFGAALNLSNWGIKGAQSEVLPEVARVLREFHAANKPIGAICIAPTLVAKVLGREGVVLTIGNDADTAAEIAKTGAIHENCAVDDYVTDRQHKVVTTPAYMYETQPHLVFKGISGLVKELVEMA